MIDRGKGERGREDVFERINFNVSYEMWKFLLTDFFKIKLKIFCDSKVRLFRLSDLVIKTKTLTIIVMHDRRLLHLFWPLKSDNSIRITKIICYLLACCTIGLALFDN
jgi:hypothetical protein